MNYLQEIEKDIDEIFSNYIGMSLSEIDRKLPNSIRVNKENRSKNFLNLYSKLIIEHFYESKYTLKKLSENSIEVKTIRLNEKNQLKENVSLPAIDFETVAQEKWKNSSIKSLFESTTFIFIIFADRESEPVLLGHHFWKMDNKVIEKDVMAVWKKTNDILNSKIEVRIKKGKVYNNFPKYSENNVLHVRPHGAGQKDTNNLPSSTSIEFLENDNSVNTGIFENSTKFTKQSFWLNKNYISLVLKNYIESASFPHDVEDLLVDCFQIVRDSHTELTNVEIEKILSKKLNISEDDLSLLHTKNRTVFEYRMAWVRTRLKEAGLITNYKRGMWTTTFEGNYYKKPKKEEILELEKYRIDISSFINLNSSLFLTEFKVFNESKIIIDADLYNLNNYGNGSTIIVSENGGGKSFLLGQISKLFYHYYSHLQGKMDSPVLKYTKYQLKWEIKSEEGYEFISLEYKNKIWELRKDDNIVEHKQISLLPISVMAVTNLAGDKFQYKKSDIDMYYYFGKRTEENSIELYKNKLQIIEQLSVLIKKSRIDVVREILKYINYKGDVKIRARIKTESELDLKLKKSIDDVLNEHSGSQINQLRHIEYKEGFKEFLLKFPIDGSKIYRTVYSRVSKELKDLLESDDFESKEVGIYFKKNDEWIDIDWMSSGELSMMESMLKIGSVISRNSIILLDDPETGLHPSWQQQFIPLFYDVFNSKEVNFHLLVATHSPNIILQARDETTSILSVDRNKEERVFNLGKKNADALTVEGILHEILGQNKMRQVDLYIMMKEIIEIIQYDRERDEKFEALISQISKYNDKHEDSELRLFINKVNNYKRVENNGD